MALLVIKFLLFAIYLCICHIGLMSGRWANDEEEEERPKPVRASGGAAIAPPASLQESIPDPVPIIPVKPQPSSYGGSVAAKIMAR